jgi:hypothetical protein
MAADVASKHNRTHRLNTIVAVGHIAVVAGVERMFFYC